MSNELKKDEDKIYHIRQSQIGQLVGQIGKTVKGKFDETKNMLLIGAVMFLVVAYIAYDIAKEMKAEILATNTKIDIVLGQNVYMSKNMTALAGTVCYNCHNTTKMFLPKTTLKLDEFVKYVRGDRFVTNSTMPVFSEKDISYDKLQEIWKTLY